MEDNKTYIEELENRLKEGEQKENKIAGFTGALNFFLLTLVLFLSASIIELVCNLNSPARQVMAAAILFIMIFLFVRFVITPLVYKRNKHSKKEHILTAEKAGRHFEYIKDELKNILQITYDTEPAYSDGLKNAALKKVIDKYGNIDFSEAVSYKPLYRKIKLAAAAGLLFLLLFTAASPLQFSLYRIINFNKDFSVPPKYTYLIKPGESTLTRGESVEIAVWVSGGNVNEISLFLKSQDDAVYREKRILKNQDGWFRDKLINVQNSFAYFVSVEDVKSKIFNITVIGRPVINGFSLKVMPPFYSNMPEEILSDNGNVSALCGSKIYFSINSSKELKSAFIEFSDSVKVVLKTENKKASGEVTVKKDISYHFRLVDSENNFNVNPAEYTIKAIPDAYPSVQILSPEKDMNAVNVKLINLISKISDDYGFSKMTLYVRLSETRFEKPIANFTPFPLALKSKEKEQEVYYTWDIGQHRLSEGDVVSYYVEIYDNDYVSGPKAAKSDIYSLRVPTIDNLLKKSDKEEEEIEKEIKDVLDESKKLKEEFNKNVDELKKNKKELSWEEKNSISNNLDNLEKIEGKIEKIKDKLASMQKELSRDNLLSKETMEKYAELQNLMNELNNEELKEAIQKMQEALKSMLRDNAQKSLDKLNLDEEYLKNSIERTLSLLKKIKVEQKIDELLKRIQNLNEKTAELAKKTEESNINDKSVNEGLSGRQEDITEGLKQLEEEMKKTDALMKKAEDMPEEEMKQLLAEFKKQNNESISQSATSAIKQLRKENAVQNDRTLSKNLSMAGSIVTAMKKSFLQKNQMKSYKAMMKALENILTLSKGQEKLRTESEQLRYNSAGYKEKLRSQNELKNNLSKIIRQVAGLSQKTFGITPEMGKALGRAMTNMQDAVNAMQTLGNPAVSSQRAAMEGLNQAAALLKGSMDKMMSGGQGSGMMSLMQQLEQLSMQQMNLNKLTQQLNKGALSMEEQAQLQRLAQQQEAIRKSLERLNREAKEGGQSKSLAGSLDKTVEEMKNVIKEMKGEKLGRDVVKQQERILSRMLDSQRSLNERDFEKNRESKSGAQFSMESPGQLNLKNNSGSKLKDELLKAGKEGYKKDYENLIKRYFEALEKKSLKK